MFDSDVENDVIGDDDVGERRSKRQRKLTQKAAEQFAWATKSNNVGNTNKGTAKKSTMLKSNIPRNVSNHRQIIACESPIRSSQDTSRQVFAPESSSSQRIAEATATTAKSKSSQSAPIGSDTSQNIVEPQLVRSSLSQKIAEITAKSKSSQSAPIRLEDTNHQVLASEFSLSTETIAETTTKSMFSPSAPIGSDTSLNILEPQSGRSSLSQKIAEITAKSNSSQSAPIGSDTSQNILEPQLVRSSLSQKIAEITAKSNSSQSAPIRLEDTNHQVLASEFSLSTETIAETTTKSMFSPSAPIGSDTSQNILEPQLVRSSLSQKIAEITAKSNSSQSAPIRLEDTNHQVLASEFSLSTETIAETTTKSMFSPSAPIGSDTSQNILEPQLVRSSLSQKIAEITAKSKSSQSAPIGSDTSQNIVEPQSVRSSIMNRTPNTTNSSLSNCSTPEKNVSAHELVVRKKRKPKTSKNWVKIADYPSYQAAFNDIKAEKSWSVGSKSDTCTYFRCNKVKLLSQQCQSGLKIVDSDYDLSVGVYASTNAHNCDSLDQSKPKLTDEIQAFIKFHFERGLKTKQIQDEFIKAKMLLPAKYLIENYIAKLRKEASESARFTLAEFKKLLDEHSKIPEDDLTAYVIDYQINDDGKELQFNFVVSSKKLLQNNISSRVCNADTTYKLIWQRYPVQITGFTDANKKFHPSTISVSSTENEADYAFIFNAIKTGTIAALGNEWKPDIIMCDAAKAISNAFRTVFGSDIVELMCWFHAKCAMKDHVSTLIPRNKQKECLEDIDKLQLSSNPAVFQKASQLFIQKYSKHEEFVNYFTEQWLHLHPNWYEGAATPINAPSCNNGLEVFNRTLKDEKTLRKRLPVQVFIKQLLQWVHTWGSRYDGGANVVFHQPLIDLPLMTKAYQWKKQNKQVKKHQDGFLMVPVGEDSDLVNWHLSSQWETFDEFKKNCFLGWSTIVPTENWVAGTCNCSAFLKNFKCKHVVGIAIRRQLLQVPFEAKQVPLGQKRKRGRPKLAGYGMVRD